MPENHQDADQTQSFVPLTKGTEIGHYKILSKIGAGGMGEVYLAEDTTLNRKVALKFMPAHMAGNTDMRERFTREAQAAAKLDHPNIVPVHEVGEYQGRPYFAMAHIEGQSLREVIKEGKLNIDDAVGLTKQILEGLHKAHEAGVVHRDIKPGNIIIDKDGRARLVDFGLAMVSGEDKLTKTGSTLGTVGYMSPEQVEGKKVDHRSDLFSVGVILYEMLTGRKPFEGDNEAAIARAITDSSPEPVARFKSGTSGELQRIIGKSLSKDPDLRYQHADGLLADLKRLAIGGAKAGKSRARLWAAVAIVIIVAIAVYFIIDRYQISTKPKDDGWTNSIAVLVFRNLSADPEQEYFCEGMTDDIINRLSSIKQLKVTSLTSIVKFKETDRSLKEIGKELKVENILEGTIQKHGDSIRVSAQLVRVKDDGHIWAERYYREVTSVFAVQDDISRSIVEAMKIQLVGDEEDALVKRGTDNLEAYNAYMRGRYFWRKRIEKDLFKALEYFENAVELDPDYALAYVGIADAWQVLPDYSNYSETEVRPKALEAITKALELDDNLAEAHASIGLISLRNLEVEKAEESFLKALDLNPNYPWAHVWYAGIFTDYTGEEETGIAHLEIALELDPLSLVALHNLAGVKRKMKDYSAAGQLYRKALEIEPNNASLLSQYAKNFTWVNQGDSALYYAELAIELEPDNWRSRSIYGDILGFYWGRREEAVEQYELACQLSPNNYLPFEAFGSFYYYWPDLKMALPQYSKAIELEPNAHKSHNGLAYCYAAIGEYDKAIDAVSRAIELSPFQPYYIDTRADIHVTFGKFEKAIDDYRLFFKRSPQNIHDDEVLNDMAKVYTFSMEYDAADSLYEILASHTDSTARGWARNNRARPFIHQGKFHKALEVLADGIEIDHIELGDSWPQERKRYERGLIYLNYLNDYEAAIEEFELAKELVLVVDSNSIWKQFNEGRIAEAYAATGDSGKAYKALRDLWNEMDTTNTEKLNTFRNYRARIEFRLGNYDSALTLIEKRNSTWFSVKFTLGLFCLKADKVERAVTTLEDAMSIYEDGRFDYPARSVMGHYYLGQAYEAAGRTSDAIEQYDIFLDIWKNADEGLESVEDAKERLANLNNTILR